jgi:hypothetical protein
MRYSILAPQSHGHSGLKEVGHYIGRPAGQAQLVDCTNGSPSTLYSIDYLSDGQKIAQNGGVIIWEILCVTLRVLAYFAVKKIAEDN